MPRRTSSMCVFTVTRCPCEMLRFFSAVVSADHSCRHIMILSWSVLAKWWGSQRLLRSGSSGAVGSLSLSGEAACISGDRAFVVGRWHAKGSSPRSVYIVQFAHTFLALGVCDTNHTRVRHPARFGDPASPATATSLENKALVNAFSNRFVTRDTAARTTTEQPSRLDTGCTAHAHAPYTLVCKSHPEGSAWTMNSNRGNQSGALPWVG